MNAPILISVRRKLSPVCQAATRLLALMAVTMSLQAQWTTQTLSLKSGWNAVYLHVDCTHADLASLTPLEIQEIWMWQPAPTTIQFVQNPQEPIETGTQWKNWKRVEAINALQRLIGNAAYLVRTTADVSWSLKGKPVPPRQQWTSSGLNFIGYPTVPSSPPTFESFFSQAPAVRQVLQTYYYDGGELGANNPRELFNFMLSTRTVTRGEAYWLRADGQYYAPYGPFEVKLAGGRALDFGETASQISFRIRNLNPATNTVTLKLLASEAPPSGELAIAGTPTLLLRGALNTVNLTHAYSSIAPDGTATFVMPPAGKDGSETEVVIGINRAALAQAPGSLLAGIVRLTKSR